ncbi:MAG: 3-deoxy-manno-octulosonate cytidylyltransferase [Candidatus Schekmanbacteria bacterium]|nr:3-deoxy-manno-octulosonate cytidylyltransferase [Candidatus Schekmanbacteria bacterium]
MSTSSSLLLPASDGVLIVIPARFGATRFPGKLLAPLAGEPLVWHVYRRAAAAALGTVVVGTDDERILDAVRSRGGKAEMTGTHHASGTDRVAEVVRHHPEAQVIVNLQGDEPMVTGEMLARLIAPFAAPDPPDLTTLAYPTSSRHDFLRPHTVKVVGDGRGNALYFSRAPIPWPGHLEFAEMAAAPHERPVDRFLKHQGIYSYSRRALFKLAALPPCPLELLERLEQLRALHAGMQIRVVESTTDTIGIDTPQDLQRVAVTFAAEGQASARPEPA